LKEIGSGCECIQSETLYFGDVYDAATGAVMQMSHGMFGHPTTLDINPAAFKLKDVENDDVAAPCGGRGIGEPCVSDVSAIECAIFNATGKWVDPEHGAMSPDKVLKALGKA
jgi:CO/xanthine dehydrogenase Mo-binding subunit